MLDAARGLHATTAKIAQMFDFGKSPMGGGRFSALVVTLPRVPARKQRARIPARAWPR
ncbi:hypothetical protein AIOL_002664 [Candidatus Rhodobacter oscarellae]|uniref:Uncharacterized protein n=1 Tax=Candidatus Rhodobacter oscarellae TaxID=1675527 RepID=A0A0J9E4N6_9RHOB|nr:hypothetical protein AIOL_002664 [Candidatus Rhodobacter lobularis]